MLGLILLLLSSRMPAALAVPSDLAFTQVPAHFNSLELTTGSRGLGETCFSRLTMPDGSVCNPAYLPEYDDSIVLARVYFGNGYEALSTANSLLDKPISKEFLEDLFKNNNVSSVEAQLGLVFTTRYFQAAFSPYRVQYTSEVHNPNLPVVALHAANERNITLNGGAPLKLVDSSLEDFTLGTRVRFIERVFVHGSFSSFDLATQTTQQLLPVHRQKALYFDPQLGWVPKGAPWKLRGSIGLKNLGKATPPDPLYPEYVDVQGGLGVEPPVGFGDLKIGIDVVDLCHAEELEDRFRFGASYKLGILEPMVGLNSDAATAGLQFSLQIFQAGIVYEFATSDDAGTPAKNRLATEVSIKI